MGVKTVDCKYCGRPNLAWVKSKRTGRFYLAHVNATSGVAAQDGSAGSSGGYYIETWRVHTRDECNKGKGRTAEEWDKVRLFSESTFRN